MIKAGVVGVGIQGEQHVKAYKLHPNVNLVAVCDLNINRAKAIAEKYGIGKVYRDYNEMFEKEDLDLVSIVTPDFLHRDPVVTAAENHVNIIVEKPFATTLSDADIMVKSVEKNGVKLYPNFSNRWNPPFSISKDIVDRGELGEIVYGYIRLSDTIYVPTKMLSWAAKSNVAFFLMSHTADLMRWFFNDEVIEVNAFMEKKVLIKNGIDTPDYFIAVLNFSKGGRALLESSWILPETFPSIVDFKMELIGEKAVINIDNTQQCINVSSQKNFYYPRYFTGYDINGRFTGFVKESIHHFIDCLLNDVESIVNIYDGLENTRILCSIIESAFNRRPVRIER